MSQPAAATPSASEKPSTASVAAEVGRQVGLARAAKNNGDAEGTRRHAEAALSALKNVELNYENLDWRQLAEGDAQQLVGNMAGAEKAYRQAMVAAPQQPGGYQRLAELLHAQGRTDDFLKHIDLCQRKFPGSPVFFKLLAARAAANQDYDIAIPALANAYAADKEDHEAADALGVCLQNINHFNEAVLYHARAMELQPTNAGYVMRFGLAMAGTEGGNAAAIDLYKMAIALDPNLYDAYGLLGYELCKVGRTDDARQIFGSALSCAPDHPVVNFYYGQMLQASGDTQQAAAHYDKTVAAAGVDASSAGFLRDAVRGTTPEHAPQEFVRNMFNLYAPNFEKLLTENFHYRAPGVLHELLTQSAVASVRNIKKEKQRILDLGCGTGLMGVLLKPYAERMVGVDLSANMLARAAEKGIYDETHRADLQAYTAGMPANAFDVVVSADVFIYIGKLDELFVVLGQKLAAKSLFAFCCEKLPEAAPEPGFTLQGTARYAHKDSYIRALAKQNGFDVAAFENSPVRQHAGKPVDAIYYVLARR